MNKIPCDKPSNILLLKKWAYRNKNCFPVSYRKKIVESVVVCVLDYGDTVYGQPAMNYKR